MLAHVPHTGRLFASFSSSKSHSSTSSAQAINISVELGQTTSTADDATVEATKHEQRRSCRGRSPSPRRESTETYLTIPGSASTISTLDQNVFSEWPTQSSQESIPTDSTTVTPDSSALALNASTQTNITQSNSR